MRDPLTFEDRLAVAIGTYAERMPTVVDELALVRSTRAVGVRRWPWPTSRLVAVLVAVLLALALLAATFVGLALSQRERHQSVNGFVATGSLHHAGAGATAVVLSDGRVLVLGLMPNSEGEVAADSTYWSEVYDPASGQFTKAGDIPPISRFTLTALRDGRVLLAGGTDGSGSLGRIPQTNASMLLDPGAGTAVPTNLTVPRADHTAALLNDGRVLLAGGYGTKPDGTRGSIAAAEIWDPHTGTSTPTGSMVQDRVSARAVTLDDGRVLVVGGQTWQVSDSEASARVVGIPAEVFDPETGTFGALAPDPRAGARLVYAVQAAHEDRLLQIDLAAGTITDVTPYPDYLPLLSADAAGTADPADTDCLPGGRQCRDGYTIVPIDADHVLIAGGRFATRTLDGGLNFGSTVAPDTILDPATGSLSPAGPVVVTRESPEAVLLADRRVLLFGGDDLDSSAEIYEP